MGVESGDEDQTIGLMSRKLHRIRKELRWAGPLLLTCAILVTGGGWTVGQAQEAGTLEAALAIEDPEARLGALRPFLSAGVSPAVSQTAREATVASWAQLAEKSLAANRIELATRDFQRAIESLPATISDQFFADTVIRIPQATSMRGYRLEGIELARRLEKRFAGEASRLAAIGEYFMTVEAPEDAIRALGAGVALAGGELDIRYRLAQAYRLGLRLDEAIREYQLVIGEQRDVVSRNRRAFYELGNLYRARGAYADAIALYEAQLAGEPRHLPSFKGLALAWLARGNTVRYQEAIDKVRELGEAVDDPAQDIYLQTQVALINLARGRLAAARAAAEAALAIEPRYAWARLAAAEVDLAEGRYFEAERNLLAAQQYASFPTLAFTLGKLYLTVEDFDGALEQFAKVITISGEGRFQSRLGGTLEMEAETLRELLAPEHQAAVFLAEPPTTAESFQIAESLLRINGMLTKSRVGELASVSGGIERQVDLFLKAEGERQIFRALYLARRLAVAGGSPLKAIELTDLVFEQVDSAIAAEGSLREYPNFDRDGRRQTILGRAWDLRGWAFYHLGRPKESEKALLESIRAYGALPEVRQALWHLGTVRETGGALAEALELYLSAYEPPAKAGNGDLNRTVIELLYRKVHGSLDGLEEKLRAPRGVNQLAAMANQAQIAPAREGVDKVGPDKMTGGSGPARPAPPPSTVQMPPARPTVKGPEPIDLTARITLPGSDPMFARRAPVETRKSSEPQQLGQTGPAGQPVAAVPEALTEKKTVDTPARPTPKRPVVLPALPPALTINDPFTPFFNQQRFYSRWESFLRGALAGEGQVPPLPR